MLEVTSDQIGLLIIIGGSKTVKGYFVNVFAEGMINTMGLGL